jgi:hypothetical protein
VSVEHSYTSWTLSSTGARSGMQEWYVRVKHDRVSVPYRYLMILEVNVHRVELRLVPEVHSIPMVDGGVIRLRGEQREWVELAHSVMRVLDPGAFALFYRTIVAHHKPQGYAWLHELVIKEFET